MKVSDLIAILQNGMEMYGDIEVACCPADDDNEPVEIHTVFFHDDYERLMLTDAVWWAV